MFTLECPCFGVKVDRAMLGPGHEAHPERFDAGSEEATSDQTRLAEISNMWHFNGCHFITTPNAIGLAP
jgi:hypothetical protein